MKTATKRLEDNGQPTTQISLEDAQAAIEADRQERVQACSKEVEAVLQKYRCRLVPQIGLVTQD